MKQVADEEMMKNALGEDEVDKMGEPPYVEVDRDHPLGQLSIDALKKVYDPEIPVNIYELGLIYKIAFTEIDDMGSGEAEDGEGDETLCGRTGPKPKETHDVYVEMTLTSPACPVAQEMPLMVQSALMPVDEIRHVDVDVVFDPPWTPDAMAETAKFQLNVFT